MRTRTLRLVHRGLGAPSGEDRNRARKMPTTATGLRAASLDDQPGGARFIQDPNAGNARHRRRLARGIATRPDMT